MAKLTEVSGKRVWTIEAESVLGRSLRCSLRIPKDYVSVQHASLRWAGNCWQLRDLGSRNGTWLDGKRLVAGEAATVSQGTVIAFGHPDEQWVCDDAGPPQVLLVNLTTGRQLTAEEGVLGIPSSEQPLATALKASNGQWQFESSDGELLDLENGSTIEVEGDVWRFSSPEAPSATITATSQAEPEELTLHFLVSSDEEYVELRVESGEDSVHLGSRSQNHLLLTLARARLRDVQEGFPPTACGWTYKEDLVTPHEAPQRVDIDVFRLRKHFARSAPHLASRIIERRSRTRQLRIGLQNLRITTI